ncbi:MAG: sulfatase [Planctomycetota bacterium]
MTTFLLLLFSCVGVTAHTQAADTPSADATDSEVQGPNFVVIFCDDLGYGDLSCYGHPTIQTPNLDQMAGQGMRATQFYVAASVCTPSRAALMTGRYPIRTGMCGKRRVLFPNSVGGLPASETTIAEMLRSTGYQTSMVGKWHLGHRAEYLPTEHGFDRYFGIPYSNDMDRVPTDDPNRKGRKGMMDPRYTEYNVPLLEGSTAKGCREVERPTVQTTLTKRYTQRAIDEIVRMKDDRFFLYLAHSLPHVPLFRSDDFVGRSAAGIYGDVIEEIDHGVGRILQTLHDEGLAENTLVVFTSDNGPWLVFESHGGSSGPLRNGKGTTFEGGMRVPGIFWMPGTIQPGRIDSGLSSTLDLLPTFAAMAGATPPETKLDGYDLSDWLKGDQPSARKEMFYYRDTRLMAVRSGDHKAHLITQDSYVRGSGTATPHDPPLIFDLSIDLRERNDIAAKRSDLVQHFAKLREHHESAMQRPESQLDRK